MTATGSLNNRRFAAQSSRPPSASTNAVEVPHPPAPAGLVYLSDLTLNVPNSISEPSARRTEQPRPALVFARRVVAEVVK